MSFLIMLILKVVPVVLFTIRQHHLRQWLADSITRRNAADSSIMGFPYPVLITPLNALFR